MQSVDLIWILIWDRLNVKKKKKLRQSKKSESRPYARLYWDTVHVRCDNGILAS